MSDVNMLRTASYEMPSSLSGKVFQSLKKKFALNDANAFSGAVQITFFRMQDDQETFAAEVNEFSKTIEYQECRPFKITIHPAAGEMIDAIMEMMGTEYPEEAAGFCIWHAERVVGTDPLVQMDADGEWHYGTVPVQLSAAPTKPTLIERRKAMGTLGLSVIVNE